MLEQRHLTRLVRLTCAPDLDGLKRLKSTLTSGVEGANIRNSAIGYFQPDWHLGVRGIDVDHLTSDGDLAWFVDPVIVAISDLDELRGERRDVDRRPDFDRWWRRIEAAWPWIEPCRRLT